MTLTVYDRGQREFMMSRLKKKWTNGKCMSEANKGTNLEELEGRLQEILIIIAQFTNHTS